MKVIKGIFNLCILLFRKLKNRLQGNRLTGKGKQLLDYLVKVINENYIPQTMAEYVYEETFNPEKLEGEARLRRAEAIFLLLSEY